MVRLKEHRLLKTGPKGICFNSKMVRLKENYFRVVPCDHKRFNSKMVRLKADYAEAAQNEKMMFQFQNGAIKRYFTSRRLT